MKIKFVDEKGKLGLLEPFYGAKSDPDQLQMAHVMGKGGKLRFSAASLNCGAALVLTGIVDEEGSALMSPGVIAAAKGGAAIDISPKKKGENGFVVKVGDTVANEPFMDPAAFITFPKMPETRFKVTAGAARYLLEAKFTEKDAGHGAVVQSLLFSWSTGGDKKVKLERHSVSTAILTRVTVQIEGECGEAGKVLVPRAGAAKLQNFVSNFPDTEEMWLAFGNAVMFVTNLDGSARAYAQLGEDVSKFPLEMLQGQLVNFEKACVSNGILAGKDVINKMRSFGSSDIEPTKPARLQFTDGQINIGWVGGRTGDAKRASSVPFEMNGKTDQINMTVNVRSLHTLLDEFPEKTGIMMGNDQKSPLIFRVGDDKFEMQAVLLPMLGQ